MADSPETILQTLAEVILDITGAGSAGVSVCDKDLNPQVFRWDGLVGSLAKYRRGSIPCELSPCNLVLNSGEAQLFENPGVQYPYLAQLEFPIHELLILPFDHSGYPVGTVWIASHEKAKRFDVEDLRCVKSLSTFASAAFRTQRAMSSEEISAKQVLVERAKLESIFAQAPTPLVLLEGPEFRFKFANEIYRKFFLHGKEFQGKRLKDVLPEAEDQGFVAILKRVYETGETYFGNETPFEVPISENNSKKYFLNFVYEAVRDITGRIEGVFAVVTDVTEQVVAREAQSHATKELTIERAKLAALVAESPSAIGLMRGHDLVFEIANAKWTQLVSPREYIGRKYEDVYPELVGTPAHQSHLDIFNTGIPFVANEMRLVVTSSAGKLEEQFYDYTNIRVLDAEGKPYGVYCNALNVTERVRNQQLILKGQEDLKVALVSMGEAKAEAERANQTKSSFLANMSHEIRTPLGAILGFTDLLRERNLASEERNQYLETISRNGKALTRIIDDILDLAKVESGKLEIEMIEFNLFDLVDEVVDLFRERAQSKGIYLRAHIEPGVPPRIASDPTRLRQILINIVGNAIKFTETGGVSVDIGFLPGAKPNLQILVKDTGVGIGEAQRSRLFEPFVQADSSTTRKFGGSGLGLVLSKRLAKALGGDVILDSQAKDPGCTFKLTLAIDVPKSLGFTKVDSDSQAKRFQNPESDLSGIKILLADDSLDNQALICAILQRAGAQVIVANNGLEALRRAIREPVDIVLMDIQMPEMDGYDATRALREAGFQRPIIALTAHAMAEERARTLAAGCSGHLTKPINIPELLATIINSVSISEERI